jgi:hypothetical protein
MEELQWAYYDDEKQACAAKVSYASGGRCLLSKCHSTVGIAALVQNWGSAYKKLSLNI